MDYSRPSLLTLGNRYNLTGRQQNQPLAKNDVIFAEEVSGFTGFFGDFGFDGNEDGGEDFGSSSSFAFFGEGGPSRTTTSSSSFHDDFGSFTGDEELPTITTSSSSSSSTVVMGPDRDFALRFRFQADPGLEGCWGFD